MRKVTWVGTCVFGGLVIASLAPQAQAQLVLHKKSFTTSVTETSLNFSDTLLLPQFQNLVHNANAQLYGVDIQEVTNATISGSVTNNTGASRFFGYEGGLLTSTTVAGAGSLNTSALFVRNFNVGAGATQTYGPTSVSGLNSTALITSPGSLVAYQGNGNVGMAVNGTAFTGFSGNPSGLSSAISTSGATVTGKITYFYYAPFTPVPELGTSISLGLMGLVGGALGLRARRRK